VRGTTEAINLVAQTWGRAHVGAGDEVLITALEHHSNIVPWQLLCEQAGARLVVAPIADDGTLLLDALAARIGKRTRLVALTHVSNTLGTINPIERVVAMAHAQGVPVLVDGAQAVPHMPVDVRALGCDFYAFSGHKLYGPTGIGVLYGRAELATELPARLAAVTPAQVAEAAGKLRGQGRAILVIEPTGSEDSAEQSEQDAGEQQ